MADNNEATTPIRQLYSLTSPTPKHFDLYNKAVTLDISGQEGTCDDPQYEALCNFGMPKNRMPLFVTMPGGTYGNEFKELSVEFFGVEGSEPFETTNFQFKALGNVEVGPYDSRAMTPSESLPGGYVMVATAESAQRFIVEFWRCRIYLDQSSLCLEMLWQGDTVGWNEHILSRPFESSTQYLRVAKAAKLRDVLLTITRRGGDRSPKEIQEYWNDANCKRFAMLVTELAPKWAWLKSNYGPNFSTPLEWIEEIRERDGFPGLFRGYKRLTNDLLLRVTDSTLTSTDREPMSLAYLHSARELGICDMYQKYGKPEPTVSTLSVYYLRGKKLQETIP
jgi:hypothetical protein